MITYFSNNTGNMGGKWSPKEVEIREEEIKMSSLYYILAEIIRN